MELALFGGKKVREELLPSQNTIGEAEIAAANRVLRRGLLTGYQANYERMLGGPEVQALEKEWAEQFTKPNHHLYCIPVNSCTSGLVVACGAIGIKPGDEVIVTPYSMTCSATAPMAWGGVPVFADVDPLTFNLDSEDVERKITPRTKAIIVVDLFGLPYDKRIDEVAARHGLKVIEDAAQAVGATRSTRTVGTYNEDYEYLYAGTLGHIGVHSFNLGKHLTCGEGGLICTYDEDLAMRCRLLINHAEAVVNSMGNPSSPIGIKQMFGFNLRMTEVNAAIMREQLKRRDELISKRVDNAILFWDMIKNIPGFIRPEVPEGYKHSYYVFPLLYNQIAWDGLNRDCVLEAVRAELMPCAGREWEGVPIGGGYIKPIWRMPLFDNPNYQYTTPPGKEITLTRVCDGLWKWTMVVCHRFFGPMADKQSIQDVATAFHKVWDNREELKWA